MKILAEHWEMQDWQKRGGQKQRLGIDLHGEGSQKYHRKTPL